MSMSGPEQGTRTLPADDLAGAVRESLSDLARVSAALDAGVWPALTMAVMLRQLAGELAEAAAAARAAAAAGYIA